MKALLLGDVHLRDVPPRMCTDDYLKDLLNLLSEVIRISRQRGSDCVVIAGDMFDKKMPRDNSHRLMQAIISLLKTSKAPWYVVPGNHDMTHDLFESVFTTQPLGVILRSGAAYLLSEWALEPRFRGTSFGGIPNPGWDLPIYGVPWLQEWDYEDDFARDAAVQEALSGLGTSYFGGPALIVAHAPFFPPGQESPYENYPTKKFSSRIRNVYGETASVFYGHIHDYHGIFESGGVTYANAGALSRGSLSESNLERGIFVTEWDSETGKFEIIPVPHRPASEVFLIEKAEEIKENALDMEDFLSTIDQTSLEITTIHSVIDYVKSLELGSNVVKVVTDLLEEAQQ